MKKVKIVFNGHKEPVERFEDAAKMFVRNGQATYFKEEKAEIQTKEEKKTPASKGKKK